MKMNSRIMTLAAALGFALSTFAVTIETDRKWYLAGEAMTVSVTADDALIAYAELCDTYGLAACVAISLDEGVGKGVIELPSDLHSGYYALSVYTRDNANVSHQLVAVINPLHRSEDDDIEWVCDSSGTSQTAEPGSWVMEDGTAAFVSRKAVDEREAEGHIIKARIKNVYDGNTFKGSQIRPALSIVGKQIHYFEGKMINDSIAVFYTYGIHGKQPLVLSARSYTGMSLPIEIISPYASLIPKKLPHLVFHYKRGEVEARSLDMQRHLVAIAPDKQALRLDDYAEDTSEEGVPLDYDEIVFGTKPELTYNLDEYRQFLTIKEVLLEYVNCVSKKKINGVPQLQIHVGHDPSNLPSLVLIDGMPVIDIERLLRYDARRILYINIYDNLFTFGNSVYNGILSFITRSGRLTNYPIEPNMQYLVYGFPE